LLLVDPLGLFAWPGWTRNVTNFAYGVADSLTFGLASAVVDGFGWGSDWLDSCSSAFRTGAIAEQAAELVVAVVFTGGAAVAFVAAKMMARQGVKAGVKAVVRQAGKKAVELGRAAVREARGVLDNLGKKARKFWGDEAGSLGRSGRAGAVPVYRVEGPGNTRLVIDGAGDVGVTGRQQLYLTFGDRARADEFLALRHSQGHTDDVIKAFDVPEPYARSVRDRAVDQIGGGGAPIQRVDATKTNSSFGLKAPEFPALLRAIIPGSGRIVG
jgi:hypothetical protein